MLFRLVVISDPLNLGPPGLVAAFSPEPLSKHICFQSAVQIPLSDLFFSVYTFVNLSCVLCYSKLYDFLLILHHYQLLSIDVIKCHFLFSI